MYFFPLKLTIKVFLKKLFVASAVANGSAFLGRTIDASKVIIHKELRVWTGLKYIYLKKGSYFVVMPRSICPRRWDSLAVSSWSRRQM